MKYSREQYREWYRLRNSVKKMSKYRLPKGFHNCCHCGPLLISNFRKRSNGHLRGECRVCEIKRLRLSDQKNPERKKLRKQAWLRLQDPDKLRTYNRRKQREWRAIPKNRERVKTYSKSPSGKETMKRYRLKNLEKVRAWNKKAQLKMMESLRKNPREYNKMLDKNKKRFRKDRALLRDVYVKRVLIRKANRLGVSLISKEVSLSLVNNQKRVIEGLRKIKKSTNKHKHGNKNRKSENA